MLLSQINTPTRPQQRPMAWAMSTIPSLRSDGYSEGTPVTPTPKVSSSQPSFAAHAAHSCTKPIDRRNSIKVFQTRFRQHLQRLKFLSCLYSRLIHGLNCTRCVGIECLDPRNITGGQYEILGWTEATARRAIL